MTIKEILIKNTLNVFVNRTIYRYTMQIMNKNDH